jgi:hypothetical protein
MSSNVADQEKLIQEARKKFADQFGSSTKIGGKGRQIN